MHYLEVTAQLLNPNPRGIVQKKAAFTNMRLSSIRPERKN